MSISTSTSYSWEYRDIAFPLGTTKESTRQLLTSVAGTGRWELDVSVVYPDGRRKEYLLVPREEVIRLCPYVESKLGW